MLLYSCTMCRLKETASKSTSGLSCHFRLLAHDVQGYLVAKAANDESFRIIERSNFTLAPRGHGSSSWRMCAAIMQ